MARFDWMNSSEHVGVRWHTDKTRPRLRNKQFDRLYGCRYQVHGKRYQANLGWASEGWTEAKAADERQRLIDQAKEGGPATQREEKELFLKELEDKKQAELLEAAKNISFKTFAEDHYFPIAEPGWKPETARKHKEHCSTWLYPNLGDMPLRKITISGANKVKAAMMKAGRAPRTMQAVFRTFSMIWTSARDSEIVTAQCPTKKASFKLPKVDNEKMRFLTTDECATLLEKVRARGAQAADMALVSLESGLRFGEVAAITWAAVDMKGSALRVLNTKGKKDRVVPMTNKLFDLLKSMEQGRPNGFVFPNKNGTKHAQVPSLFKRGLEDAKLNEDVSDKKMKASFHTLRHTYASRMVQQGVDIYKLQRILGHSTPTLTARYAKLADDDLRKAVEQMETREKMKAEKKTAKVLPLTKANGA